MSDFAPPTGPPPPKVPEGWKAVWNEQYSEWFFVNLHTKQSQWNAPTEPVYPTPGDAAPPSGVQGQTTGSTEKSGLASNNPYAGSGDVGRGSVSEDEKLARRLQEEEDKRGRGREGGAAGEYYTQGQAAGQGQYGGGVQGADGYAQQQQQTAYGQQDGPQDRGKRKSGLLGKIMGKVSGHSTKPQQHQQQPYYGAAPGGYYQQQHHPGMMGGHGGMMGGRRQGGGMGPAGALALGAGGGLLGGALLGSALADAGDHGGDFGGDGGDFGGDGGGDFGGGDFGGF